MLSALLVQRLWRILRLAAIPLLVVGMTAVLGFAFRVRSSAEADMQLRERLLNTVSVAALAIDPDDIASIVSQGESSPSYNSVVQTLKRIRALSPYVRFTYLMRRTDDPLTLAFVADADANSTRSALDVNRNGMIDADEAAALPGQEYPIDDDETLQTAAFAGPIVSPDVTVDQWGRLVSAYAPILDEEGMPVAVLGMDINERQFKQVTQGAFSIFILTLVLLCGIFLAAYLTVLMRRRRYETLAQLDADRTAMIDLATHQLGAPLATFRWWLELLKERESGSFCKRDDDICMQLEEGIERLGSVIEALNRAGNIQRARYKYRPERVAVGTVARQAKRSVEHLYRRRNQSIVLKIPRTLHSIRVDRTLFEGVLSELLENASWYSADGATVIIRAEEKRGKVVLSVEDHGYGIAPEDLPHVGEQLRRGVHAAQYKPIGNGLGLYIARRIVERAGGTLRLQSVFHQGTTVTITLPAV